MYARNGAAVAAIGLRARYRVEVRRVEVRKSKAATGSRLARRVRGFGYQLQAAIARLLIRFLRKAEVP